MPPLKREVPIKGITEGSLEAPKRQPIDWRGPDFHDAKAVETELERVFDICHGCRRCVSLCAAFPTLFDLIDESDTFEVDGVDKADFGKVVEQCFLCDLCAETKCPYLPPHEWAVDFPHLMLRAKAARYKATKPRWRDRLITSTDPVFRALSTPGVGQIANAAAKSGALRKVGERIAGVHKDAPLPNFVPGGTARRAQPAAEPPPVSPGTTTTGKVAIYVTCYGEHNEPDVVGDLVRVLEHNGIAAKLLADTACCGMPKFELGDLEAVAAKKDRNLPVFLAAVEDGYDLMSIVPSCTLMYRQELPLLFPDDADVARVQGRVLRSLRILGATQPRRARQRRLQQRPRQGDLPRRLPPARAGDRPAHVRVPEADPREPRSRSSSAARAMTAPTPSRRKRLMPP